jgi:serine protease AprX
MTTSDDIMASYSSKGPTYIDHIAKPDLVAPGNNIISLMAGQKNTTTNLVPWSYYLQTSRPGFSDAYFKLSGTSMAAPMVAGAAALLVQKDPSVKPDSVKVRLMRTARRGFPANAVRVTDSTTGNVYEVRHDVFSIGAGYLDIFAALQSREVAISAMSPTAVMQNGQISLTGSTLIWPDNIIWGGEDAMEGTNIIWGGDDNGAEAQRTQLNGER